MITLLLAALLLAAPHKPSDKPAPAKPAPVKPAPPPAARPAEPPPETKPEEEPEEWAAEYVEYRCMPELGHITISDGMVRGRKPVEYLRSHGKELAARGIFPCTDKQKRRTYRRSDEVGGHTFETLVVILPPKEKDDDWVRRVTVLVDGRKKLDCSIGDSPDGDVFVYGVTIFPEDGTIQVSAVDADGEEVFPPEELELIKNPGVITDDTLQPDSGDDDDMPKPLERA
jgi:hypothetical protein